MNRIDTVYAYCLNDCISSRHLPSASLAPHPPGTVHTLVSPPLAVGISCKRLRGTDRARLSPIVHTIINI